MKTIKRLLIAVNIINIAILAYALVSFNVDDMTLLKGEVYEFNEGWTVTWEDETVKKDVELPYHGKSEKNRMVTMENTIPKEFYGKTMYFLSADKTVRAYIDGEVVYEFGINDERDFGHTPGSVEVFIDIPEHISEGHIVIEMESAYNDYASILTEISVADKDTAILKLFKDRIFHIIWSIAVFIICIVLNILFVVQKATKQKSFGVHYLAFFCGNSCIYFFIETRILTVFYGNQTLYSIWIFIILMIMPVYLFMYYEKNMPEEYKKRFRIMLYISFTNIFAQNVLQLFNIFDYMEMSFISHIIILGCMFIILETYWQAKDKIDQKRYRLESTALFILCLSGILDMLRYYILRAGDMAYFQRIGTTLFGIIMIASHIIIMANNFSGIRKKQVEEIEQQNKLLMQAKEEAQAANIAKTKFLANMSHEIRTPINTVLGMDEMIIREAEQKEIVDYAVDIQNAGNTLLAIINDILDFSKIESGKLEIKEKEYDFASLIHDTSLMASFKAEEKSIDFIMSVDNNLPSRLYGDDARIRQVLDNLLTNGIKYTKAGFVQLVVRGERHENKVRLYFEVIDTGIGIKQEDIPRLFNEFDRIDETANRDVAGTGLGLNITSELVSLMGGKLEVRSEFGKGTNMFFTLEQTIINEEPIGNLEERVRQRNLNKNKDKYRLVFEAPEANVLVVDDNEMNRRVFKSLLKKTKINVDEADGGIQCLEMIQKKHYDIIFLDHMMPNMDGIQTFHAMETLEGHLCKGTPVVVLTANAVEGAREMYLNEGFDNYMSKPVVADKLENMIQELLPSHMVHMVEFNPDEQLESVELKMNTPKEISDIGQIDGVDLDYAFYRLQDLDVLMTTIHEFYRMVYVEADNLKELYEKLDEEGNLELYRIKVHAMKSSAALIGAMQLSGVAKTLEYAARDGKTDVIKALTEPFLEEWREYRERLKPIVEGSDDEKKGEPEGAVIDPDVIRGLLSGIDISLQIMDVDKADELMEKLQSYRFTSDIEVEIDKLSGLVVNLEIEKITEQVNKISEML